MVFRKFFRPSADPFNLLKSQPNRPLISPKTQNLKHRGTQGHITYEATVVKGMSASPHVFGCEWRAAVVVVVV
jgi:hypothetical protein